MPTDHSLSTPKDPRHEAYSKRLLTHLTESIGLAVPWFFRVMPEGYFNSTDPETMFQHLRAIVAAHGGAETPLSMWMQNHDGTIWTYIGEEDRPGLLHELLEQLPQGRRLRAAEVHTALDGSLVLNIFRYASDEEQGPNQNHPLVQAVMGSDDVQVEHRLEDHNGESLARLTVAAGEAMTCALFGRLVQHLTQAGIDIRQANVDVVISEQEDSVSLFEFFTKPVKQADQEEDSAFWLPILDELRQLKWLDRRVLERPFPSLSQLQTECLMALCDLSHQKLCRIDPHAYARDRIRRIAARHEEIMADLSSLFIARFADQPPIDEYDFQEGLEQQGSRLEALEEVEDVQKILTTLVEAAAAVLRCNLAIKGRYGLGMRLDPAFFADLDKVSPFGIFFVHGRGFNGFHVRFRDIARGGVRIVRTMHEEQHVLESERFYQEVYGLASAQQLKNKDIPEGGSKAVLLQEPHVPVERSVKAFGESLLDLLVPDSPALDPALDRYGREEWLYLGPHCLAGGAGAAAGLSHGGCLYEFQAGERHQSQGLRRYQ